MAALPPAYAWLADEPGPKMLVEALALFGTLETPGTRSNPVILSWADEIGGMAGADGYARWADDFFEDDAIPWCGLFMGVVAKRAGKALPTKYLSAVAWGAFGVRAETPLLGDVLVFTRAGGGHVTLYVGEDAETYHGLGGNQSDAVGIARFAKSRRPVIRRPVYRDPPANLRRIRLSPVGALSTKET